MNPGDDQTAPTTEEAPKKKVGRPRKRPKSLERMTWDERQEYYREQAEANRGKVQLADGRVRRRPGALPAAVEAKMPEQPFLDKELTESWDAVCEHGFKLEKKPWSQLEDEGQRAYNCFKIYLRLGPLHRTVLKASAIYYRMSDGDEEVFDDEVLLDGMTQKLDWKAEFEGLAKYHSRAGTSVGGRYIRAGVVPRQIQDWSARHKWLHRAKLWDEWFYSYIEEQELELRRQESIDYALKARALRKAKWDIVVSVYTHVKRKLADESLSAKDLAFVMQALERAGVLEDRAFAGVRDILHRDDRQSEQLPPEVAAVALRMLAEQVEGYEQAPPLVLDGDRPLPDLPALDDDSVRRST